MRKWIFLLLFVLLSGSGAVAAEKQQGVQEFTSIEELAMTFSLYFPKVQGEVTAVRGDELSLSVGRKQGILPGMMITLWREGRKIQHPVTKAVLGRAEDEVGTVEVTSVQDTACTAAVRKKMKEPRQGDTARITPKKINIAIVPLRDEYPAVTRSLSERLREFGRFNVLESSKVDAFVKNTRAKDTQLVRELGRAFGLDAVVSAGIYPSRGKLMVTARIFYTEDGGRLDTLVAMLDLKTAKKEPRGEIAPFFAQQEEEKAESPELPFMALFFTAGDFEGDGTQEYAFTDGIRLHVYRNQPFGWREVWTEVAQNEGAGTTFEWQGPGTVVQPGTSIQHISLDTADINGNGRPELFVTAMLNGKVFSYVIEFREGAYRRIAELPGFLRVVSYPGKGTVLIGQGYDEETFYSGATRQYSWSDGKYLPSAEFSLPEGIGLYGWTFANLGESEPMLVVLDQEDHLLVFSKGRPVWKSAEQFTALDNYVYKPVTGVAAVLSKQASRNDKSRRERLRGRVLAIDLNADGMDEIIVPKNLTGKFLGGFTSAELVGLSWTGARLDPSWSIKDIPGPVHDFIVAERAGGGSRISVVVRTKGSLFSKDRQQVMSYSIR